MEIKNLIYLCIYYSEEVKEYKFGGKYILKNEKNKINIENNSSNIHNYFKVKGEIISEITGIVGKNGSGKTSLLKFIRNHVIHTEETKVPFCAVFDTDKDILVYKTNHNSIEFADNKIPISIKRIEKDEKMRSIFLSTVFDRSLPNQDFLEGIDMSTTTLLKNPKYESEKLKRDITFFNKINKLKLKDNFELDEIIPEYILIELFAEKDRGKIAKILNLINTSENVKISLKNILQSYSKKFKSKSDQLGQLVSILFFTRVQVILQSIIKGDKDKNYSMETQIYSLIKALENCIEEPKSNKELFYSLNKQLNEFSANLKNRGYSNLKYINHNLNIFNEFFELYLDLFEKSKDSTFNKYSVKFEHHSKFKKLFELYEKIKLDEDFLFLSWRELSSGEEAIVDIFSRLSQVAGRSRHNKPIYLLIDEIDNMLHPEWQRRLITSLVQTVSILFKTSVQIIITSHSPFIVSDLPHTNIIYLGDVHNNLYQQKTIGANIHTLFSHSFFMKYGTIGEYSKRKIDEYQQKIIRKQVINNEEMEEIEKFISLIGEPIIKRAFERELENKNIDKKIAKIKNKIEEHNRQLEELKNEKNRYAP